MTWRDAQGWENACQAESIAREEGIDSLLCDALLCKGKIRVYSNISGNDHDGEQESLAYFEEALACARSAGSIPRQVDVYYNIAQAYIGLNRMNDPPDADLYGLAGEAVDNAERLADGDITLLLKGGPIKARYLRQGGRFAEALQCCNDIISKSTEQDYLGRAQMISQTVSLYALLGDMSSSVRAHQDYANTVLQYMQHKGDFMLQEMETQFESSAKEIRITRLRTGLYSLAVTILVLIILVVVSVYYNSRFRRQREQLDAANRTKDQLLHLISDKLTGPDVEKDVLLAAESLSAMDTEGIRAHCEALFGEDAGDLGREVGDYFANLVSRRRQAASAIGLTARELEIIRSLSSGKSTARIAEEMCISVNTVKSHKQNIFSKLGASNSTEMLSAARALGLL